MNIQTIQSVDGQDFVLLPARYYRKLEKIISKLVLEEENNLANKDTNEYTPFALEDYFSNPIALARINAGITQGELAKLMGVSQAYISQLENSSKVSGEAILKVNEVLANYPARWPGKGKSG